jgi:alkylation response protein AidB-like acyl-CoA dehydrogenase
VLLSETQMAIRDTVRRFAQDEIRPRSRAFEAEGVFPPELFTQLAGLGLMGMTAPEEVGGAGADYVSYALALIELGAADSALSTIVSIQNSLMVSGLLKNGSPSQQARFLPDLTSGRMIGAFALTETDAGSDASAIATRAVRFDGGWRLNGTKQFITSGKIAGVAMVFAVTNPAAGKNGISGFLVPTDRPGYIVDKVEHKLGPAASDTCAIRFENLFIEDDLLFGPEGEGYRIALSNLEAGRIGIAAQCIGMAQAALLCLKEASMAKLVASELAEAVVLAPSRLWAATAIWKNSAWRKSIVMCGYTRFMRAPRIFSVW